MMFLLARSTGVDRDGGREFRIFFGIFHEFFLAAGCTEVICHILKFRSMRS